MSEKKYTLKHTYALSGDIPVGRVMEIADEVDKLIALTLRSYHIQYTTGFFVEEPGETRPRLAGVVYPEGVDHTRLMEGGR